MILIKKYWWDEKLKSVYVCLSHTSEELYVNQMAHL